ncbi:MAG: alkaline phosphatase family protein, partial [bacterium]
MRDPQRERAPSPQLLIIGIDGATFDLMSPWMKAGKLPSLRRVMEEGAHGELISTTPPNSAAAWTSFMTGKNPGKHGVFDFFEPIPHSYA